MQEPRYRPSQSPEDIAPFSLTENEDQYRAPDRAIAGFDTRHFLESDFRVSSKIPEVPVVEGTPDARVRTLRVALAELDKEYPSASDFGEKSVDGAAILFESGCDAVERARRHAPLMARIIDAETVVLKRHQSPIGVRTILQTFWDSMVYHATLPHPQVGAAIERFLATAQRIGLAPAEPTTLLIIDDTTEGNDDMPPVAI